MNGIPFRTDPFQVWSVTCSVRAAVITTYHTSHVPGMDVLHHGILVTEVMQCHSGRIPFHDTTHPVLS